MFLDWANEHIQKAERAAKGRYGVTLHADEYMLLAQGARSALRITKAYEDIKQQEYEFKAHREVCPECTYNAVRDSWYNCRRSVEIQVSITAFKNVMVIFTTELRELFPK